MARVSGAQKNALDAYFSLMTTRPQLFINRRQRPIIKERAVLEAHCIDQNLTLGVAATTPHFYFLVDLVASRGTNGEPFYHPYMRVVQREQLEGAVNVAILGTIEEPALGRRGDIVLLRQERHATGSTEVEIPRGFGNPGVAGEVNALRELEEETGYKGETAELLGSLFIDTGLTDGEVHFYHIRITGRAHQHPEPEEAISGIRLLSPDTIWNEIRSGRIRDSFTLQALALYEKHAA